MNKKIFFISLILFMCAGCKVRYTIEINEDNTVEEKVSASEDVTFFENYPNSSVGRVVGFILEPYLDTLNANEYEVTNNVKSNSGGVIVSKSYSDIETYSKNTIFYSQFTDKINCTIDGDIVTLVVKGKFSKAEQDQTKIKVDDGVIAIKLPFKVLENNADEVNGDTYIWSANDEENEIRLVYNKSKVDKKNDYSIIIIIGIIVALLIILFIAFLRINAKKQAANEI